MTITFHCSHCGKKIEAKDKDAGKRGTCPGCHNKISVPNPDADEELKLAPLNENEEARKKQLMAETHRVKEEILRQKDEQHNDNNQPVGMPVFDISDKQLTKHIITYLRQMTDGKVQQAENTAELIIPHGGRAVEAIDRIALSGSEMPEPELADIPAAVLSGLIRQLREKMN